MYQRCRRKTEPPIAPRNPLHFQRLEFPSKELITRTRVAFHRNDARSSLLVVAVDVIQ